MDDETQSGLLLFFGILLLVVLSSGVGAFYTASKFDKSKLKYTLAGLFLSFIVVAAIFFSVVFFDRLTTPDNAWAADSEEKGFLYVTFIIFSSIASVFLLHWMLYKRLKRKGLPIEIDSIGSETNNYHPYEKPQ